MSNSNKKNNNSPNTGSAKKKQTMTGNSTSAAKKGKKALQKSVVIEEKKESKPNNNEGFCKLKSAVACPQHLLDILLKQTDLTEPQIHVRYMKFRHLYPTGFVGPHVLRNLCLDVLNEQECEEYVDMVFKLYGQRKRGWGVKLIGFREVLLATHNIHNLHKPDHILRWIFRIQDAEGAGEIPVSRIENIISSLLSLCVRLRSEESAEELTKEIIGDFDMKPYDDNMISEEEFVYDCLNNYRLSGILKSSLKTYTLDLDFMLDSDEEQENVEKSDNE